MGKTNFCFTPGKLTVILDAQAGSSGKGVIGSYVTTHADNWSFACNTYMPNAGHWVKLDNGKSYFYQTLNSCAYQHDKYERLYIGPGACIELPALFRELEENGVPRRKLRISPLTSILQDIDGMFEKGLCNFDGTSNSNLHDYDIQQVRDEEAIVQEGEAREVVAYGHLKHQPLVPGTVCVRIEMGALQLAKVTFNSDGKPDTSVTHHACVLDTDNTSLLGNGIFSIKLKLTNWDAIFKHLQPRPQIVKAYVDYEYRVSYFNKDAGGYLAKTGTTAHGCGANRARRVLRKKEAKYARDIPELAEFICDVPGEIMNRLDRGEAGLLEIAQGFQLSYMLPDMFPFTTSRNCTVAAGFDDMMVPPCYGGNVILNFRTFPIRINSNKYIDKATGEHLTWAQVQERAWADGIKHALSKGLLESVGITLVEGNSGPGYPDQHELTWEELTRRAGAKTPICEMTSVTKLPRRVFSFSQQNLKQAIRHNRTGDGEVFLSLNFVNYVDDNMTGVRGRVIDTTSAGTVISKPVQDWINENLGEHKDALKFLGTGPLTDDKIDVVQPLL